MSWASDEEEAALMAAGMYKPYEDPWFTGFKSVSDEASAPWFRAIFYIEEYEDDRCFRYLIKSGVKVPEEMHEHIDAIFERLFFPPGKRKKFKVETKRGPKEVKKLWTKSLTEEKLFVELEGIKFKAEQEGLSTDVYLNNQLNGATGEKHDHIMKLINLHGGRRGSAKKRG